MTKILLATPELSNVAMVGGIAEYLWGLAGSLLKQGHDVRVVLPHYAFLKETFPKASMELERLPIPLGPNASTVSAVARLTLPVDPEKSLQLPVYLLGGHKHFETTTKPQYIYDWPNHEPWIVFCKGVFEWLHRSDWLPDVLHTQDAHGSLLPVYIQELRSHNASHPIAQIRTVLTIHNLLNQGKGPPSLVSYAGLPSGWFHFDGFEFYGNANCLKAGLLHADRVNTVSRTYASEICNTEAYGFGLEGVLREIAARGKLSGIVNGIDTERWKIPGLPYNGKIESIRQLEEAKASAQQALFPQWGWQPSPQPVLIFRSRWDNQKGVLLAAECMKDILDMARCVFVSWGGPGYTAELRNAWNSLHTLAKENPNQLQLNPKGVSQISETATHYTLGDFVLMPSIYEPCGLVQMECLRFGTLPIVRQTGGLADTVSEQPNKQFPAPNGFSFQSMEPHALLAAIRRAVHIFHNPELLQHFRRNALLQQNSWDSRIAEYELLYSGNS